MLQRSDEYPVVYNWFPAPGDSVGNERGRVLPFGKFHYGYDVFVTFTLTNSSPRGAINPIPNTLN
jgi:hypothetical protein